MDDLIKILDDAPQNDVIQKSIMTLNMKLDIYRNPLVSISGGADSDILLHLVEMVRGDRPVTYMFFDTGMEYEATKRHLRYLGEQYGIVLEDDPEKYIPGTDDGTTKLWLLKAKVPVPLGCKKYGLPFLSKLVSDYISRLQKKGFQWEDEPLEVLEKRYPGCRPALRWWCNDWGEKSRFNIEQYEFLKEFIMQEPPDFEISLECCTGAKKATGNAGDAIFCPGLKLNGMRKAEGGTRSTSIKSCFSPNKNIPELRPLFFWKKKEKVLYKNHYRLRNSDAYEVYKLPRTGCACCPFGSKFEKELKAAEKYEPGLHKAACSVFGTSYEYTRRFRRFQAEQKEKKKRDAPQKGG